jgi:1-acyl-sn-glycerol-3-phosphate acyltransferase
VRPGDKRKYARGGANLAIQNNVPIIPIAHNAGQYWPADTFIKYPGTITVFIGEPIIAEEKNSRELTEQAQQWIEDKVLSLAGQANSQSAQ